MSKINLDVDKDDIRYVFKLLYDEGKIDEAEYQKALSLLSGALT